MQPTRGMLVVQPTRGMLVVQPTRGMLVAYQGHAGRAAGLAAGRAAAGRVAVGRAAAGRAAAGRVAVGRVAVGRAAAGRAAAGRAAAGTEHGHLGQLRHDEEKDEEADGPTAPGGGLHAHGRVEALREQPRVLIHAEQQRWHAVRCARDREEGESKVPAGHD